MSKNACLISTGLVSCATLRTRLAQIESQVNDCEEQGEFASEELRRLRILEQSTCKELALRNCVYSVCSRCLNRTVSVRDLAVVEG